MIYSRKLDDEERYKTSLLIASSNLEYIKSIKKQFGGYGNFLNFLVTKNLKFLKVRPDIGGKVLTEYQSAGLDLKKLNFIPHNRDWILLRAVASHYTISISLLVSLLLEMFLGNLNKGRDKKIIVHVHNLKILKTIKFNISFLNKYLLVSKLKI